MKKVFFIGFLSLFFLIFSWNIIKFSEAKKEEKIKTQEMEAAQVFLEEAKQWIETNFPNEWFDGITNILSFLPQKDDKIKQGSLIVKEDGKFSFKLYYDYTCCYKDYEEEQVTQTKKQEQCDSYATNYRQTTSMYSWNNETLSISKEIIAFLKDLKVNTLYQSIASVNVNKLYLEPIIQNYTKEGIAVYQLLGDADWTYDITTPKKMIEEVIRYNETVGADAKIKGVTIDIEPHGSTRWKNATETEKANIFKTYVKNMIELYDFAHKGNLEVVLCTNTWFNYYEGFEELYKNGADTFSIMNYDKRYNVDTIVEELEIAEKYHKKVETIAHSGKNSEPTETYFNDSLETLLADHEKILARYPYERFRASYHYFPTIQYLKNKTVYVSVYVKNQDYNLLKDLYLIDSSNNQIQGIFVSLMDEQFFLFPNLKEGEYQFFSPTHTINPSTMQLTSKTSGRKQIQISVQSNQSVPKVGDFVLYPFNYTNEKDGWSSSSSLTGWRILNIDKDTTQLVSAGTPLLYSFTASPTLAIEQMNNLVQKYFVNDYALKVESLTKEMIDNFCTCDSYEIGMLEDSLIKNESNVLLASLYDTKRLYLLENTGDIYEKSASSTSFGIRPVITIKTNQLKKQDEKKQWILEKLE